MNGFRTSASQLLAAVTALVIVIAAVATGWLATDRLDSRAATSDNTETLAAAFGVARHAGSLVSASAVRTNFRMTPDSLEGISASVAGIEAALYEQLEILEASGQGAQIRQHVDALVANAELIRSGRPELLSMLKDGESELRNFRYGFSKDLEAAMTTSMDDQIYHLMTGYDDFGMPIQATSDPISVEVRRLFHMANLMSTQGVAMIKLRGAAVLPFAHMIPYIQEDFESEVRSIQRSIQYLSENGAPNLHPDSVPGLQQIISYGEGDNNIWDRTTTKLQLAAAETRQIAANESILQQLFVEVDEVVASIRQSSTTVEAAAADSASAFRTILLIIGLIGVAGTLFATWFFGSRSGKAAA